MAVVGNVTSTVTNGFDICIGKGQDFSFLDKGTGNI